MVEIVASFFMNIFKNSYLSVFFISIIPMIEVRGAIPIGWTMGLDIWVSYVFSVLSAFVICPILILFLKPVLGWLKKTRLFKKIALALENTFKEKAAKIDKKADSRLENAEESEKKRINNTLYRMLGVFLFVAIPLPLTGVWTGTAVAVFLGLKWWQSMLTIVTGNFVAGAIITGLTLLLGEEKLSILLWVLLGFVVISLVTLAFGVYKKAHKKSIVSAAAILDGDEKQDGSNEV